MNILVTGGAGFIGANFLLGLVPRHPGHAFTSLDALTYAGDLARLAAIVDRPNHRFVRCDLRDWAATRAVVAEACPDVVVHFAAETHVDRSITGPAAFMATNITGTFHLLEACREVWGGRWQGRRFHHVSTDEVYGSIAEGSADEWHRYDPSSPYAASKAASDHLVRAAWRTYGLPITITAGSNTYGPWQHPEKLIPCMLTNALAGRALPVYGDGGNIRDWLHVDDHCAAIWAVVERGRTGETYNVGGDCERRNIDLVRDLCRLLAEETGRPIAEFERRIASVTDRPGHDRRYALTSERLRGELGWRPLVGHEQGLRATVRWHLGHRAWAEGRSAADG